MIEQSDDLKQWTTSAIVDRFIAIMSPFGSMDVGEFAPIPGLDNKAVEFKIAVEEARLLAAELNRRADPEAGDRLWGDPNPAVRMGILSLMATDIPRELRMSAMIGPLSGLQDEEAGRLFLDAFDTKEERIPLTGFNDDELVDRFIEFCRRNFMAWNFFSLHDNQEQIDASNNIITEVIRILVALKERNCLSRLLPLLQHENQNVRLWAADGALFVQEQAALATLTAISEEGVPESARMFSTPGPGLTNISAMNSLDMWRKERRGVYGLNAGDRPPS